MSKRISTDETHKSMLAPQLRNDATPADLALRLRNMGSRVRKSVTEGYSLNRYLSAPSSPYSSPTKVQTTIFQSANDTLHDVFLSMPPRNYSAASPRKRTRSMTDHESQDDPVVDDGGDTEMQTANDDLIRVSGPDTNGERLVKPMRRSRRPFTETRSLPVGLFRLSGQPNDRGATSSSVEDDWSLSDPKAGQLGGL